MGYSRQNWGGTQALSQKKERKRGGAHKARGFGQKNRKDRGRFSWKGKELKRNKSAGKNRNEREPTLSGEKGGLLILGRGGSYEGA